MWRSLETHDLKHPPIPFSVFEDAIQRELSPPNFCSHFLFPAPSHTPSAFQPSLFHYLNNDTSVVDSANPKGLRHLTRVNTLPTSPYFILLRSKYFPARPTSFWNILNYQIPFTVTDHKIRQTGNFCSNKSYWLVIERGLSHYTNMHSAQFRCRVLVFMRYAGPNDWTVMGDELGTKRNVAVLICIKTR